MRGDLRAVHQNVVGEFGDVRCAFPVRLAVHVMGFDPDASVLGKVVRVGDALGSHGGMGLGDVHGSHGEWVWVGG